MTKQTFVGKHHRAQVVVFDYSDSPTFRHEPPKFKVSVLPWHAHPTTSFSNGKRVYWGTDFAAAWKQVTKVAPHSAIPNEWCKYLEGTPPLNDQAGVSFDEE